MPNAAVTVTNVDNNASQKVLTGPDGSFTISGLAPGTYRVDVETAGFKRTTQQNVILSTTGPATVNIALEAGNMNETVNIKGHSSLVQSENAEQSEALDTRTVRSLPVQDRNWQQLTGLMSGVTPPQPALPLTTDPARNRFYSTNGQLPYDNLYQVDGVDNHEPFRGTAVRVQPTESVQQMNITTANPTVDKGFSEGAIVTTMTRPGTNPWHGSLFEFYSGNPLRARNYFATPNTATPHFAYNQFGATAGGAIVPDKFFFFGSYEGTYDRGGNTMMTTVPTPAMVAGNFSGVPGVTLYNPGTGTAAGFVRSPFTNNTIPGRAINPTAAAIASFFPAPNLPGYVNNYVGNVPFQHDMQKLDGRVDAHFTDRTGAFVRYGYSNLRGVEDSILGPVIGSTLADRVVAQNAVASVTHEFSPTVLTELRLGYNRYKNALRNGSDLGPLAGMFGLSNWDVNFLPQINIAGFSPLGTSAMAGTTPIDNDFNIVWNWAVHTSHHNFKAGADLRNFRADGWNNLMFGPMGGAVFGPGPVSLAGAAPGTTPFNAFASSFASFLTGAPTMVGAAAYTANPTYRQNWYGLWLGDSIQPFRRLTLDLGVRWDLFSPIEPRGAGGAMLYSPVGNTLSFPGTNNTNLHSTLWDLNNIAPRIGLAFRLTDRSVIRAGYGWNYFQVPMMMSGYTPTALGNFSGVAGGYTYVPNAFNFYNFPAFQPVGATPALTSGMMAPNMPMSVTPRHMDTPYVQQVNFGLQQEFVDGIVASVGYVGQFGRNLPYITELNAAFPGSGVAGMPFAGAGMLSSVSGYDTGLTSNYNSLQVNLNKRFAHDLSFSASYTYSRALGYTGSDLRLLNPFDRAANYGPADFNRTHVLTFAHLWQLPVGAGSPYLNHGVIGQILGGWQLNGILTWSTGTPFTVTADPLFCACPGNTVTANINGPVSFNSAAAGMPYFNASGFSMPAAGQFGNLGRNAFTGPSMWNYDMSLFKSFGLVENWKLELRGEAYNLTNSAHWANPVANLNSPAFGTINNTVNGGFGRQVNVALRLLF